MNRCNYTLCRYNKDGECISQKERDACVEISKKVLCLDGEVVKKCLSYRKSTLISVEI